MQEKSEARDDISPDKERTPDDVSPGKGNPEPIQGGIGLEAVSASKSASADGGPNYKAAIQCCIGLPDLLDCLR
uniref:Uncharacterized protein n=1 Tax=Oryza alta TaxID=52545 RepID=A0A1V1H952_9ORYZ|nr:hypothetical protein [Oryza alta]